MIVKLVFIISLLGCW